MTPLAITDMHAVTLDPALHAALKAAASEAGLSLSDYCTRKLALPLDVASGAADGNEVVRRAAEQYGVP